MKRILILSVALMLIGWSGQALAQATKTAGGVGPAPVNVVQDCWTTSLDLDPDPELELYTFDVNDDDIDFIWKQKLLVSCSAYRFLFAVFQCVDGKQSFFNRPIAHAQTNSFGPISPIPGVPEPLFAATISAGTLAPGRYDSALLVECDDTDGALRRGADIDDVCGVNVGLAPIVTPPVPILGPDPIQFMDADPGGSPAGRGPGENGTTRPWCFEVTGVPGGGGAAAAKVPRPDDSRPGVIRSVEPGVSIKGDGVMDLRDAMEALRQKSEELQQQKEEAPDEAGVRIDNYPNPFTRETTISYTIDQPGEVKLTIYDALGRKVRVLVDGYENAGTHRAVFDGAGLSAGVYFYNLEVETKTVMGKLVLQN